MDRRTQSIESDCGCQSVYSLLNPTSNVVFTSVRLRSRSNSLLGFTTNDYPSVVDSDTPYSKIFEPRIDFFFLLKDCDDDDDDDDEVYKEQNFNIAYTSHDQSMRCIENNDGLALE